MPKATKSDSDSILAQIRDLLHVGEGATYSKSQPAEAPAAETSGTGGRRRKATIDSVVDAAVGHANEDEARRRRR